MCFLMLPSWPVQPQVLDSMARHSFFSSHRILCRPLNDGFVFKWALQKVSTTVGIAASGFEKQESVSPVFEGEPLSETGRLSDSGQALGSPLRPVSVFTPQAAMPGSKVIKIRWLIRKTMAFWFLQPEGE
jgi:hypothetical protein